jgi:hypothetical protein
VYLECCLITAALRGERNAARSFLPKAALIYVTRRPARDRTVVTAIAPGAFASEMNRASRNQRYILARSVPMGRIGEDMDMAACAIYLASRAGYYMVGATIRVDGGIALAKFRACNSSRALRSYASLFVFQQLDFLPGPHRARDQRAEL